VEHGVARLILKANETQGTIGPYSQTEIIGTAIGFETVYVEIGGKAIFDPSFNRGGDEIIIQGNSEVFQGVRSGSNLLLTNDFGAEIYIPAGSVGAKVTFDDGTFLLVVSNGSINLGDQPITTTAAPLNDVGAGLTEPPLALHIDATPADDVATAAPQSRANLEVAIAGAVDHQAPHDTSVADHPGLLFLDAGVVYGAPDMSVGSNMLSLG
jgi:hypothetical protein